MKLRHLVVVVVVAALATMGVVVARGRELTSHGTRASTLGAARSGADFLKVVDLPGTLEVETVNSADWAVPRSGLINLDHPEAKKAGLKDGDEPIHVFFHAVRHPQRGLFIVDTGVEQAVRDAPERSAIRGLVARLAHIERMRVGNPLSEWLARQPTKLAGVFFTHLHLDHITGLPDVPKGTPLYVGPGEASDRMALYLLLGGTMDRLLEGQAPLQEWQFQPDPDGRFAGVVDVFGDGQFWALWMPGHTLGSVAYLARTPSGPILLTGDTCHTVWGWEHSVEPGTFTADHARNIESLARLERLKHEHPALQVRMGHQMP